MFKSRFLLKIRNLIHIFGLFAVLLLLSCATTPKLNNKKASKNILEQQTSKVLTQQKSMDAHSVRIKIEKFRKSLEKGTTLNEADWKLHDELLNTYIELKNRSERRFTIPALSKTTIPFETYCLNSGKASPTAKEIYHWQKDTPSIPYYKKLLGLRYENQIAQHDLQTLLWNLQNETRWDDYPNNLKAVLQKIDPHAAIKLPSKLKDQAKDIITDTVLGMPGASGVLDTYELIKGKYYEYDDFKRSVESIVSKHNLSDYNSLTQIPGTELYTQSDSQGFSKQEITFYNPTNKSQELKLDDYYLAPEREDVQRIGINPKEPFDSALLSDLEKVLYENMARLGIGFTPGINDIADLYELLAGKDFVSGASLSATEHLFSAIGIVAGSGAAYRYVNRVLASPTKYLDDFAKGLGNVSGKTAKISADSVENASKYVERANHLAETKRILKSDHGRAYVQKLPDLSGSLKEAFNGHVFKGTYEPGEILFQAQRSNQRNIGNWFGPIKPLDSKHAEELFNIQKWGNDASEIKTFIVKERVSGYAGKVAGGNGHQFFIPPGVPLEKVLVEVK